MSNTPRDVFVSYHTDSSKDVVVQLVTALEASGISCWYAPRDVEGRYASSIMRAIGECKVFLVVLNKGANMSEHVMNEIESAFNRFSKHEDITLLPFRIDEFEMNLDITYYLGRIHIMDGGIPPAVLKVKELINRISNILGIEHAKEAAIPEPTTGEVKKYRLIGNMEYPDNCFVGRKSELQQMEAQFSSHQNKMFLVGMGGVGKSEIAKKYCDEYSDRYDVILWVAYSTNLCQTVINDFAFPIQGVNRSEHPEMSDEQYFQHKVKILKEIADGRVLIIIDNMDVLEDPDLQTFCGGSYSVLFTTRFHGLADNIPELEVQGITDMQEMFELFQAEYPRELEDDEPEIVDEILKMLNGHPLSIRLVASAMKSGRIRPEAMLELLQNGSVEMKNQSMKAADIIFGRLRQVFSLAALSEDEIYYLKNLSLMPLQGIKVEKLYKHCNLNNYDINDELVRKSWIIYNSASDEVHLHPLVAELMGEELAKDMSACDTLLASFLKELPKVDDMKFAEKRQAFRCYESIIQKLPKNHTRYWELQYAYASVLIFFSNYDKGIALSRDLFDQTDVLLERLKLANKIAKVYNDLARPEEAIAEAMRGLDLVKDIPEEELQGKEGAYKRNMYIRLAEAYRTAQDYDLAEQYMRKTMDNCHIYFDSTPEEERGWTAMFMARILTLKTDEDAWEESEELFEEVDEIFKTLKNTRAQGFNYLFWSQLSMRQEEYDKALDEIKKAYKLLSTSLGEVHLNIALARQFEANIYRTMGEEEKAMQYYRMALEILKELKNRKMATKMKHIMESDQIGYLN